MMGYTHETRAFTFALLAASLMSVVATGCSGSSDSGTSQASAAPSANSATPAVSSAADTAREARTVSSSSTSPVGHRWTIENDGIICYDNVEQLETARQADGSNFENMMPMGVNVNGRRLGQGDIISVDTAGDDYYVVTPIRALMVHEGGSCALDIGTLQLSGQSVDAKRLPTWKAGSTYRTINEPGPCFATHDLAAAQYDAEIDNVGTGNGDQSLYIDDHSDDPQRFQLKRIEKKVLIFYVLRGAPDLVVNGANGSIAMKQPHTGQTMYCAHENEPHEE